MLDRNYLNIGCGYHYSDESPWTNVNFFKSGENVIAHNLLLGIPFKKETFDMVYHSHVLEHFSKSDGKQLIEECFRVLKPGGTIRIAVPDLEIIAKNYLTFLNRSVESVDDQLANSNYEWSLVELLDQLARNCTGGEMLNFFRVEDFSNKDYVLSRMGEEGKHIMAAVKKAKENHGKKQQQKEVVFSIRSKVKRFLISTFFRDIELKDEESKRFEKIGRFRLGGEIHLWMYDRNNLTKLLQKSGFKKITIVSAKESRIEKWEAFQLDANELGVRKPDSIFIEASK
jgi:predicted SAM-dependent methyltransferase